MTTDYSIQSVFYGKSPHKSGSTRPSNPKCCAYLPQYLTVIVQDMSQRSPTRLELKLQSLNSSVYKHGKQCVSRKYVIYTYEYLLRKKNNVKLDTYRETEQSTRGWVAEIIFGVSLISFLKPHLHPSAFRPCYPCDSANPRPSANIQIAHKQTWPHHKSWHSSSPCRPQAIKTTTTIIQCHGKRAV